MTAQGGKGARGQVLIRTEMVFLLIQSSLQHAVSAPESISSDGTAEVVFRASLRSRISADHRAHPRAKRVCSSVQKAGSPGWFWGPQAGS